MTGTSVRGSSLIRKVLAADTDNFVELVGIARLSPGGDFRFKVFRSVDFGGCNLSSFDFTGSRFEQCNFAGATLGQANFAQSRFIRCDRATASDWPTATLARPGKAALLGNALDGDHGMPPQAVAGPPEHLLPLEDVLRDLTLRADDSDWSRHFRSAMSDFEQDPRLLELAAWWLARPPLQKPGAADVLVLALSEEGALDSPDSLDVLHRIALEWLQFTSAKELNWVPVWVAMLAAGSERQEIVDLGWARAKDMLQLAFADQTPNARMELYWTQLWSNLVSRIGLTQYTRNLAYSASDIFESEQFASGVLIPLYRQDQGNRSAGHPLLRWLAHSNPNSRVWPRAYRAALASTEDPHWLISLGLAKLGDKGLEAPNWSTIWRQVRRHARSREAQHLAEQWLLREDVSMQPWPEILIELLKDGRLSNEEALAAKASSWLEYAPNHSARSLIAAFASRVGGARPKLETGSEMRDKRAAVVGALEDMVGVTLQPTAGARFSGDDGAVRLLCLMSKNYRQSRGVNRYWFGYYDSARKFLSDGERSYVALVCMDRDDCFVLPAKVIDDFIDGLSRTDRTSGRYWHLEIVGRDRGLFLIQRKTGRQLALEPFAAIRGSTGGF